jgi:8-oxo-dGTP pyrophosphatase MutT (NUDIX family)
MGRSNVIAIPRMMPDRGPVLLTSPLVNGSTPSDPARAALFEALHRHVPADAREKADRDAILRLVETEPACFSRRTFAPGHITGSAFVVCPATGLVLLHHHRRLDTWLQMGGHDDGERDARATALREAREESGLNDLTFLSDEILDLDIHAIPAGKGEPPHLHHDVRYAVSTHAPEAIQRDAAESIDLRWFTLGEAAEKMNELGSRRALTRIAALLQAPVGGTDPRG